jgi:Phage-related minor tail protein
MALILGELATVFKGDLEPLRKDLARGKEYVREHGGEMKTAALAAGAAIGVALGAGLAGAMDKSRADALVAAQLGATPAEAAKIGKLSGEVYGNNFGANIQEVNDAIRNAAQNGLVDLERMSAEAAQKVTENLLTVSAVVGEDTERVSAAITQLMRTGMAKSSEEAMDLITKATQGGLNKAGDLLDTLNEYPTVLKTVGLDGRTAMGLVSQGLQAGARDSDKVADALKELGVRAVDGSKMTMDAFKMLGVNAKQTAADIAAGGPRAAGAVDMILDKLRAMPATAERAQIVQNLFGGPGEDLGAAIFALDVDKAAASMGNLAGATDQAGKTISESAGAQLDGFRRQVQAALVEKMAEALPHIQAVFGFLSEHSAIIGPIATGLAVFAGAIFTITTAMKAWAAVQVVLNLALWTSPITWIVLGIIALVAAVVLIATKTDWFQRLWGAAWGGIKAQAARTMDFLQGLPGKIGSAFAKVGGLISAPFRAAFNKIAGFWNSTVGRLSFTVPSWVPGMGGNGFSMPNIPQLAKGGTALTAGLAIVGENGPELLHLGRGATVQPLDRGGAGGISVLRLIVATPDGRTIKDELIDAASLRGQSVDHYLGIA